MAGARTKSTLASVRYWHVLTVRGRVERIMVVVHERGVPGGSKLFGTLRSFDQFTNLVLEDTVERVFVGSSYGERRRGLFVIRGENIVLLAQINAAVPEVDPSLEKIEWTDASRQFKAHCSAVARAAPNVGGGHAAAVDE